MSIGKAQYATTYPEIGRDKYSSDVRRASEERAWQIARQGPEAIERRERELDQEWDAASLLQLQAGAFGVKFLLFGSIVSKKYFWGAALVGALMLQQKTQGWSPAYALYRKLGKRTTSEIEEERVMLYRYETGFDGIE